MGRKSHRPCPHVNGAQRSKAIDCHRENQVCTLEHSTLSAAAVPDLVPARVS